MNEQRTTTDSGPIVRACRLIAQAENVPSLDGLARAVGMTRYRFYRLFIRTLGVTPKAYADALRRVRLQENLSAATGVAGAVFDAGFGSGSRVYENPSSLLGMTPSVYRRGAPGVAIRWAMARSDLGWLMVAASDKGVCMIEFGESRAALSKRLRTRFPEASLLAGGKRENAWLKRVVDYVHMPAGSLDLPLDVRGTAFQQQVWQVLRGIPPGETVSYAQLAHRMGRPGSARAVASAVASNGIAVAIPCHRVIGSDGSLRGYRWGLNRKAGLLRGEREANQASASNKTKPD